MKVRELENFIPGDRLDFKPINVSIEFDEGKYLIVPKGVLFKADKIKVNPEREAYFFYASNDELIGVMSFMGEGKFSSVFEDEEEVKKFYLRFELYRTLGFNNTLDTYNGCKETGMNESQYLKILTNYPYLNQKYQPEFDLENEISKAKEEGALGMSLTFWAER